MKFRYMPVIALSALLVVTIGCGQPKVESKKPDPAKADPKAEPAQPLSKDDPAKKADESVLTLTEDQLTVIPDSRFLVIEAKLPPMDQLKKMKELKVVSGEVEKYSFNETDIYMDMYDEFDEPLRPSFMQLQLPSPVIEKTAGEARVSFPGENLVERAEAMIEILNKEEVTCHRIRVRILATDNTQPGNPVLVILYGTVWEASN